MERLERDLDLLDQALTAPDASSAADAPSSGLWSFLSSLW